MAQPPLTEVERTRIVLGVQSVFTKYTDLRKELAPIYKRFGLALPSTGVTARDVSEQCKASILQHSVSFTKGPKFYSYLHRYGHMWEVRVYTPKRNKDAGLTINANRKIVGQNYIVINYERSNVIRIFVLWEAQDAFFKARKLSLNLRSLLTNDADVRRHTQVIYSADAIAQPRLWSGLPIFDGPAAP